MTPNKVLTLLLSHTRKAEAAQEPQHPIVGVGIPGGADNIGHEINAALATDPSNTQQNSSF